MITALWFAGYAAYGQRWLYACPSWVYAQVPVSLPTKMQKLIVQAHVVSGVLHGNEIANTAQDYLNVIKVRDAIYRSAEIGQKIGL